jgi:hypothetical protein
MLRIFIDIETIPDERQTVRDYFAADVEPPSNYRKPETIAAWERDERPRAIDHAIRKLALDPWFAQIICICVSVDDQEMTLTGTERDILIAFNNELRRITANGNRGLPVFIGHVVQYDLRTIAARSVVNRLPIPHIPYNIKPWSERIYDTANFLNDKFIGMDKLCLALGIEGKDGFDGSMVYDAYLRGEISRIATYCLDDVRRTREIYNRLTGVPAQ